MKQLFELGQIAATPGALDFLAENNITSLSLIERHMSGDWGDLCDSDKSLNEQAITNDPETAERVFSCYEICGGKVYCITEWDRSLTTLLLPSEY